MTSIVDRLRTAPLRLRAFFRRDLVERELDDELQYHLEQQIAKNLRHGMPADEARYAALRDLGGVELRKEQMRDTHGTRWLDELLGDLRFALRGIRRAPGFSFTIVLTLTLGIGANTTMFTLLRGTLLKPLPNRHGEQLVYLRQSTATTPNELFSVPEIADYRAASTTLSAIAEYSSAIFTLTGDDGLPVHAQAGIVTGNYFEVMGLAPILGRLTDRGDDGPAVPSVAVLTYEFWKEHFGGDSAIVGRTVRLDTQVSTIVGVVQRAAHYPRRTDVFVNTVTSPHHMGAAMVTSRTHRMTEVFGRLAPHTTVDRARAELARLSARLVREHPEAYGKTEKFAMSLAPLRAVLNERATRTLWVLMTAAGFVLFIACANVANLTLMRGVRRERELHVRAALGAGGWRLRRLLIVENLTLSLAGGVLGVLVSVASLKTLVAFAEQLTPRAYEIHVDGVVLAVGFATSIVAAIALSFVPRIGGALAPSLTAASRRITLGRGRQRAQQSLVVAQLAVCMVLLTAAGLLVRTLANLQSVDTGVRPERVLTLEMPIAGPVSAAAPSQATNLASYERIRDRVAALPGVDLATLGSDVPLRRARFEAEVAVEGVDDAPNATLPRASLKSADPGYFKAAGIPLLAGRTFTASDRAESPLVVVLNASFAKQLFGNQNPIGKRVAATGMIVKYTPVSGAWRTVVGVVGDTRDQGLEADPTPAMFEPFAQGVVYGGALVVRTRTDPVQLEPAVIRAIRQISPHQMIEKVETLEQVGDETVAPRRVNATFIALFGVLAMVIAMVGIAGVLAFSVSTRIPEIGIRMSLGADASRVRRMVLGEGGVLLVAGVLLGLGGAVVAVRVLRGMLFGVAPNDPATLVGVAVLLGVVGVIACWLPAARAAAVDPAMALRAE
jgi:putative ABC transport system permease protein